MGINKAINDLRNKQLKLVDDALKQGIPPTVISLVIDNVQNTLKDGIEAVIKYEIENENKQAANEAENVKE